MSLTEYEGTVPHHEAGSTTGPALPSVLLGRIARRYAPSDPASRSKKFFEYDVVCDVGSETRASTRMVFRHCIVASAYGGAADFSSHTLRVDTGAADIAANWGPGSRTLVLAINGSVYGGVIIGGTQHPGRGVDTATDDNAQSWRFNGVQVDVRDDGSFSLRYTGAQNVDGTLQTGVDDSVVGSSVKFASDGSVTIGTTELSEFVRLDREKAEIVVSSSKDISIEALNNVQIQLVSDGTFTVGLGTDAMVKGTTYRAAEALSNSAVISGTSAAAFAWGLEGTGNTAGAAAWAALAALGPGLTFLSTLVQPPPLAASFSAAITALVAIAATAAAANTAAAPAAAGAAAAEEAAATAVLTMESEAEEFLSLRSSLD